MRLTERAGVVGQAAQQPGARAAGLARARIPRPAPGCAPSEAGSGTLVQNPNALPSRELSL
jgi:hypothetical protein